MKGVSGTSYCPRTWEMAIWCSHSDTDGDAILLETGARLVGKYLPTFGRRLFRSATSALRLHKPWWCRQKHCRNFGDILSIDTTPYRRKLDSSKWLDYTGLFEMIVGVLTTCHLFSRYSPMWFLSMGLRQGSGLCSSSSHKYPGTEGTNQNRHWNHHRWHATDSLERTRLSC